MTRRGDRDVPHIMAFAPPVVLHFAEVPGVDEAAKACGENDVVGAPVDEHALPQRPADVQVYEHLGV